MCRYVIDALGVCISLQRHTARATAVTRPAIPVNITMRESEDVGDPVPPFRELLTSTPVPGLHTVMG